MSEIETCRWYDEDDDGRALPRTCTEPAAFLSCVPTIDTPTCAKHKCRCAKSIVQPEPARCDITGVEIPSFRLPLPCPTCGRR